MQLQSARALTTASPQIAKDLDYYIDWIAKTPKGHTVKGMYVGGLWQTLDSMGVVSAKKPKIQAFKDYPLPEYMELLVDAAVTLYPRNTVRDGLENLGQLAIPTFARSIVGGVIMGTVGRSWELGLKCVSRGYEVSLNPGKAVVAEIGNGRARVELRKVWNFGDSYQVGVVGGLMHWCSVVGEIRPVVKSMCDVDLEIEWHADASKGHSSRPGGRSRSDDTHRSASA
jgi:uncharacterized protein (TIGR02265 family)